MIKIFKLHAGENASERRWWRGKLLGGGGREFENVIKKFQGKRMRMTLKNRNKTLVTIIIIIIMKRTQSKQTYFLLLHENDIIY